MAGSGEVIPNGSIHWKISHQVARGGRVMVPGPYVDPTPVAKVGCTKGHKGKFRVRLRFKTRKQALRAVRQAAVVSKIPASRMFEVVLDVPAVRRTRKQAEEPSPNKWAQLRVDW